jgi:hypothetical protein
MDEDTSEPSLERKRRSRGFNSAEIEPFVKSDIVAQYLGIDPGTVVRFAKSGLIPGHPLRVSGRRMHWRFLLSEIREAMLARAPKHVRKARTKERS